LDHIQLIPPSFFTDRGPRGSWNPFFRIQNRLRGSGPTVLLKNSLIGLRRIKLNIIETQNLNALGQDPVWIPSGDLTLLSDEEIGLLAKVNLTLGPNIDWFNKEIANVVSQWKYVKVIVPHQWVIQPVEQTLSKDCRIFVWFAGVDTDFWHQKVGFSQVQTVLIYLKNLNDTENLEIAENFLRSRNISFIVLRYGSYSKTQLKRTLKRVTAAIWIGGTESQGLALIEFWSMNIPTLVLKKSNWISPDGQIFPASSAPYMNDKEGLFSNSTIFSESDFEYFFSKLSEFSPRNEVKEIFSLTSCASSLLKLLNE
jgi:hypothetical protein